MPRAARVGLRIYFDTGKAEVKPESDAALKEIAKLLQQNPQLKLYVVGHTDNAGTWASNMDLFPPPRQCGDPGLVDQTRRRGGAAQPPG